MAKVMGWCEGIVTLLVIALFMCRDSTVHAKKKSADVIKKCETCRNLVTKFQEVCMAIQSKRCYGEILGTSRYSQGLLF